MAKIKKYDKSYQKPSDKFWRENFMKVLNCMYHEEATWSMDKWKEYGISSFDQRKIREEFERFQSRQNKITQAAPEESKI